MRGKIKARLLRSTLVVLKSEKWYKNKFTKKRETACPARVGTESSRSESEK